MVYKNQYKQAKWQRKRMEILERDDFQCQLTFNREDELCVHHKYYTKGNKIWEYSNTCFVTINKEAHDIMHHDLNTYDYYNILAKQFDSTPTDVYFLLYRIKQLEQYESKQGIQTAIQLLTSYFINIEDI